MSHELKVEGGGWSDKSKLLIMYIHPPDARRLINCMVVRLTGIVANWRTLRPAKRESKMAAPVVILDEYQFTSLTRIGSTISRGISHGKD
jgi:hypothetical protein